MSRFKTLLAATAVAAMMATAAQASVVVFDDFEGYGNADTSVLNFTAFNNLHVVGGTVDLIGSPNAWGLITGYASGFVDLDGSTENGGALYTNAFNFNAGDLVTLQFDLSGNQRGGTDDWNYGFETAGGAIAFNNVAVLNAPTSGLHVLGDLGSGPALSSGIGDLAANAPWVHYSISFTAGNAGSLVAFAGTSSHDNIGPLIDNFSLAIGPAGVPEPASWMMMIMGFGGLGAVLRRRRTLVLA